VLNLADAGCADRSWHADGGGDHRKTGQVPGRWVVDVRALGRFVGVALFRRAVTLRLRGANALELRGPTLDCAACVFGGSSAMNR
jgi:hypothetical protein